MQWTPNYQSKPEDWRVDGANVVNSVTGGVRPYNEQTAGEFGLPWPPTTTAPPATQAFTLGETCGYQVGLHRRRTRRAR